MNNAAPMTAVKPAPPLAMVDHALALAALDFQVFPVKPGAKKPAITGWQDAATNDPKKVRALWAESPDANTGVFTGRFRDGALLVIDVDTKGGKPGEKSLSKLEKELGELPSTYEVLTPSGGEHRYFFVAKGVKQSAGKIGEGIDIRSRGSYVLGVGSIVGGETYDLQDSREPLPAPKAWIAKIGEPSERKEPKAPIAVDPDSAAVRAIDYLRHEAPLAIEGAGGDATTYAVAARVKDFGPDQAMALGLMSKHWNPRCTPPWDVDDLAVKVFNAYEFGQNGIGSAAPEAEFKPIIPDRPKLGIKLPGEFSFTSMSRPLIKRLLSQRSISMLIGPPGAGKTALAVDLSVHIASDRDWRGHKTERFGVLYVAAENPGSVEARFLASMKHHGLTQAKTPVVLVNDPVTLVGEKHQGAALIEIINWWNADSEFPIGFLVIDTLAAVAAGADENSAQAMGELIGRLHRIQADTGVHVMLVHHTGKDETKGARGSSALQGAVDTEIILNKAGTTATVSKQRDGAKGDKYGLKIESVKLGVDEEGDDITSAVSVPARVRAEDEFTPLTGQPAKALEALRGAIAKGEPAPAFLRLPPGKNVTTIEKWREACQGVLSNGNMKANSVAFFRSLNSLTGNKKSPVGKDGNYVWLQRDSR